MHRSSSIANFKIQFNPRQSQIGTSSIDKLPIRKCNSSKSISQLSQISQNQQRHALQSQQKNIQALKRMNESLQRQNAYLKKQLDFFTQACSSRRSSLNNIIGFTAKNKQESGYKDKIISRLDSKIDKNDTQSTGLFSSKISSGTNSIQQSISQTYTKFNLKKILPKIQTIKKLITSFSESIQENYLKLKIMAEQTSSKSKESEIIPKQTNEILAFLQIFVVYCRNPKAGKKILKQKQSSLNRKQLTKQQKVQDILNQFGSSSSDLIILFQSVLNIGIKNEKFLSQIKNSVLFMRLIKKLNQK